MNGETLGIIFQPLRYVILIQTLAGIGAALGAIEVMHIRSEYRQGGIYDWGLLRTLWPWTAGGHLSSLTDALFRYPNYLAVMTVQLVASLLLLTQRLPALMPALVLVILATRVLFLLRHQYGGEGADQMQIIVFAGLAAYYVAPDAIGRHVALWFIGLQAIVAYLAAGTSKLSSPAWRDGRALVRVMNSDVFGNRVGARLLARVPQLSRVACWAVIIYECASPLLIVAGPLPCLVFITCGVVFHLSNAAIMGLNKFLWSFGATYPALLYVSHDLHLVTLAAWHAHQIPQPGTLGWRGTPTTAGCAVIVGAVLCGGILVVQGWRLWAVSCRYGRLERRLEAGERYRTIPGHAAVDAFPPTGRGRSLSQPETCPSPSTPPLAAAANGRTARECATMLGESEYIHPVHTPNTKESHKWKTPYP